MALLFARSVPFMKRLGLPMLASSLSGLASCNQTTRATTEVLDSSSTAPPVAPVTPSPSTGPIDVVPGDRLGRVAMGASRSELTKAGVALTPEDAAKRGIYAAPYDIELDREGRVLRAGVVLKRA